MTYENYVTFKRNCSVNKFILRIRLICRSVSDCFCTTKVMLNGVAGGLAYET